MTKRIKLSEHFGYKKLISFTFPSIIMVIFTSIYGIVDGIFVSNFVGKTSFAAINFIMPFLVLLGVVGFMLGTGGSALVAKTLGENNKRKANRIFSLIVFMGILIGIFFAILGIVFLKDIAKFLGAGGMLLNDSVYYGKIILIALPAYILQYIFQPLMITAERPSFGLAVTIIAGVLNMILDFLLIVVFGLGLKGAAIATAIAQTVGGLIPLIYFSFPNTSTLRIVKTSFDGKAFLQSLYNGLSEFVASVSMSFVSMLYNYQLLKYIGEDGVAAYGVLMYVLFVFSGVYVGYELGTAPLFSYNYGAKNDKEMKNLFSKSVKILTINGIILTIAAQLLTYPLSKIFVGYDRQLFDLTCHAFRIYSISFLISGYNYFASAFFTALNNGLISAIIATGRTLVFETAAVLIVPLILGIDGIWFAIIFAEILSLILSCSMIIKYRKRYKYM